jgi:hypothetical protein
VKIERVMRNDIPAEAVYEMSCSKQFQEQKCRDAGALSYDVRIEQTSDGTVISTRRKLPTVGFPSLLRKFVPAGVTSTEVITWRPEPEADGSRVATLAVDFHGAPAGMTGTITIRPDGEHAASVLVDATFTAHVPLVGRKVEGFAAPIILGVIDSEEQTGLAWAARTQAPETQ